jgi:hypothetical protein
MGALFVQPAAYHYFFGDYFQDRYTRAGFVPWIDYRVSRFAYDPNFNYYRLGFAGYGTWERGLRQLYQARFQGDIPRPPRTLVQQQQLIQNITTNNITNTVVNKNINITNIQNVSALAPLTQVNNTRVTNLASLANVRAAEGKAPFIAKPVLKLQTVAREQRIQEQKAAAQLHSVAQQRHQMETRMLSEGPAPVRVTDKPRQAKIELPRAAQSPGPRLEGRPVPPSGTKPGTKPPPPVRVAPPPPSTPKHEDRPIPRHEPPHPPSPPKHTAPPPPHQPAPPAQPPKKETPPPKKEPPPPPPKKEPPPPPPPKKEPPPPPPKKEPPPKKG